MALALADWPQVEIFQLVGCPAGKSQQPIAIPHAACPGQTCQKGGKGLSASMRVGGVRLSSWHAVLACRRLLQSRTPVLCA